ncbi:transcriptional regulator [Candidatus Spongiihabitans sp.]|uniref:transcriptional regulator n=1 Tax=Candidatus Spongiihabitans sp. TaxID=3101308 RepID=UPI003C7EA76A
MKPVSKKNYHHYATCGLDSVYLVNGFEHHETGYGHGVSVHDLDGLHRAIGLHVVNLKRGLTGKEFRFLRVELDRSQKSLGDLLKKTDQAVAIWEKRNKVPREVDIILRNLYMESIGKNPCINDFDRTVQEDEEICFREYKNGWKKAA